MNESTNLTDEKALHEGTRALQDIAADVERERAQRGRSEFEAPDQGAERAIADEAALSADHPDADADTREDHAPGTQAMSGRAERGVESILARGPERSPGPH